MTKYLIEEMNQRYTLYPLMVSTEEEALQKGNELAGSGQGVVKIDGEKKVLHLVCWPEEGKHEWMDHSQFFSGNVEECARDFASALEQMHNRHT